MCEGVEGQRVVTEIADIENGFGVGEVQASKIGIEACVW